jgi:hypothetical protein
MSHPARVPVGTMEIDGKTIAAGRRRHQHMHNRDRMEAAA